MLSFQFLVIHIFFLWHIIQSLYANQITNQLLYTKKSIYFVGCFRFLHGGTFLSEWQPPGNLLLLSAATYALENVMRSFTDNFDEIGPTALCLTTVGLEDPLHWAQQLVRYYIGGLDIRKENAHQMLEVSSSCMAHTASHSGASSCIKSIGNNNNDNKTYHCYFRK